jgi:hypothetical protein
MFGFVVASLEMTTFAGDLPPSPDTPLPETLGCYSRAGVSVRRLPIAGK